MELATVGHCGKRWGTGDRIAARRTRAKANSEAARAALEDGHDEVARILIDARAKESLCETVECGHIAVVRKMIQQGANPAGAQPV